MNKKWCLVHIGNDITYGLAYVAVELLMMNHKIMWLDGDDNIEILNKKVKDFAPNLYLFRSSFNGVFAIFKTSQRI